LSKIQFFYTHFAKLSGFICSNNFIHSAVSDKKNENDLSFENIKEIVKNFNLKYSIFSLTLTRCEIDYRQDYNINLKEGYAKFDT
jgi:archaellum biogenesis protein FlaJ (TadC family)